MKARMQYECQCFPYLSIYHILLNPNVKQFNGIIVKCNIAPRKRMPQGYQTYQWYEYHTLADWILVTLSMSMQRGMTIVCGHNPQGSQQNIHIQQILTIRNDYWKKFKILLMCFAQPYMSIGKPDEKSPIEYFIPAIKFKIYKTQKHIF